MTLLSGALSILALSPLAVPPAASRADDTLRFESAVLATAKDLPNPVAFTIDERGVIYTAHARRYDGHGLFDFRAYPQILRDDWTSQSVEDRERLTGQWIRDGRLDREGQKVTAAWLAGFSEEIRRLEDTNGDGLTDRVTVFAAGMNELVRGAAAGVLAWDGRVFATIVPELLVFEGADSGAPRRRIVQDGFGLHMGQSGHDMHGLVIGNDGRLYWSIADRGFRFTTREGRSEFAHTGAVLRCWPDGSGVEVFARGFRNPQELAFNDDGDLFTGDNNADVGDRSRLLYVPEGSDAGWSYYLQSMRECGPWTREQHWKMRLDPRDPAQPAWINVPVAYAGSCPAGFAAYPGTGLPARFDGTLWLADFIGGVRAYRPVPKGAGYEIAEETEGFRESWGICDFDFGYDGRMFALYWGESWRPNDKSRLVALTPRAAGIDTARVAEVKRLFRDGFAALDGARLAALLGHADRRVRQRASFELARRGERDRLVQTLERSSSSIAKLHALWGLGIIANSQGETAVSAPIARALRVRDARVRRLAAILLGEIGARERGASLLPLLRDSSSRVRFAAAQSLAKLGTSVAFEPLLSALEENDDADALLRFAASRALSHVAPAARISRLSEHASRAVRLGAILALREARAEEVREFLSDRDPQLAIEAARAAYDRELPGAMTALAATLPGLRAERLVEPCVRRALHAALRVGGSAQAESVAAFAAGANTPAPWREEALRVLSQWDEPDSRDGVWGIWNPLPKRSPGLAHDAIVGRMNAILAEARGDGLAYAIDLALREKVVINNQVLLGWTRDESQNEFARLYALQWLHARRAPEAPLALEAALASRADSVFAAALAIQLARDPVRARVSAERALASPESPLALRQATIRTMGASASLSSIEFTIARLSELALGTLDPRLALDLVETARASRSPEIRAALRGRRSPAGSDESLADAVLALQGGDAARGRALFGEHPEARCIRCHAVDGAGGTSGPDLSMIGAHERPYLMEALLTPASSIARGYENTAMPPMGGVLAPRELRDLIEYLSGLRDVAPDLPLGDLVAEVATTGLGVIGRDRTCTDNPLRVAGRTYTRGLGVHAPSRLVFAIPAGAREFVARAGVDDEAPSGSVGFEVRIDGRAVWRSETLRAGQVARIRLEIPEGAKRVELIANDGGNDNGNDHADWLDPGFLR